MTYSEALLSFALVSVIGAVAALSFGAFREKRDLEKARLNFLLKVSEIKNKLKRDLEEAILTNGATSTINAGDNAEGAEKFFGLGSAHQSDAKLVLQVFKPFNHIFSVAASVTPATERTGGFVNITPWPLTSDAEKSRYWMGAMSSAEYLLMSNDFTSFIFKKGALKTTDVTAGRISSQTLTRLPATQRANFLRTVDRVLWLWDKPSEILSRQGHFKQNPNYVEIISEDVSSFRVAYTFRARDEEDVAILPELPEGERPSVENLPATLIEAWEQTSCGRGQSPIDPQGSVLDSCVKPENINDVYIQMKIKTPLPTHLWIDSVDSYEENFEEMNIRFQREEGQVIATINFQVSPKNYSTSRVAALASGDDLQCDPNKPENRCQPACSSAFTNPDRGASNWIGYGRYVGHPDGESSYCKCWTNPSDWNSNGLREVYEGDWSKIKIWDPRFIERSPDYARSIPENEQVEACGREYGNCSTWDPQHKHPGYRVACGCLQTDSANGSDHFSQRSPDRRPRFDSETASESGGFTLNQDQILRALAPLNALNRSLHCSSYRGCWDSLSRYLQGIGQGHLTSGLSDIFQERCQCLTRNIPFACDTAAIAAGASPSAECLSTTGSEIWNTHINWDLVCNLNHRHNSLRNPKTCPLTWTSTLTPTSEITVMQPFRVDLKSVLEQPVENSSFSANGYYNEYATGSYAKIFGLTRDAMNVCECIRGNLKGSYSANSYVPFDPSSERPYLSDGWNLDLRANGEPPPGILNPTEQRPHATYGSVEENKSPDFFALVGSDKQRLVQSEEGAVLCGALMCQKFKGPSCCTDRREESEGTGAGKVSNENLKPWSGYCNEECGLSSFGSAALAPMQQERDRIRRYITNTPSDQELPTTCGGSARTPDGGEGAL